MAATVWACVKDPGGTNGVLPVVAELRKRGVDVLVIANGKAPELDSVCALDRYLVARTPADVLGILPPPRVLITSVCSGGGVGRDLIPHLRERSPETKIVRAQDLWGGGLLTIWRELQYRPDFVWANDAIDADIITRAWPDFERDRIWLTGYPALDRYAALDAVAVRKRVRLELRIPEEVPIVLFAGQLAGTSAALKMVVSALNSIGRSVFLIPRQHPRMANDAPLELPIWEGALALFRAGETVRDSSRCTTTDLVSAADLVIGEFTTVLVEAAALHKDAISIQTPEMVARYREATGGLMEEFPLTTLGCAEKVSTQSGLRFAIEAALSSGLGLGAAQTRHFSLDGKNAERVADWIEMFLK